MIRRIGVFLFLVSTVMLILFFMSDVTDATDYRLLLVGFPGFLLGIYIIYQTYKPPEKPERFRLLKRIFGGRRKKRMGDEGGEE
ncbi:MAG: hypothetical protein JXB38_03340 [Anaerolineales bacterium]|nr:hypothetical protein [Anaerolineales bacterium]